MRSRGLKIKLLTIAIAAGLCIWATLFALEYFEYRKSSGTLAAQVERSLLEAETQRLDALAGDLMSASAPALESALRDDDVAAVRCASTALLENPAVIAVSVTRPDGSVLVRTGRSGQWTSTLAAQEQRSARRVLGGLEALGTLEIGVGRPGLLATASALRAQLEDAGQRDFGRWMWIITVAGALITALLALAAWTLAKRLERPIAELIRSAERIGEGDYTGPHAVTSNDEIAELERALDRMRQKLRQTTITTNLLLLGLFALQRYLRQRARRMADDRPLSAAEAGRADALLNEGDTK